MDGKSTEVTVLGSLRKMKFPAQGVRWRGVAEYDATDSGAGVDNAELHKIYGAPDRGRAAALLSATFIGCDMKTLMGNPLAS